MDEKEKEHFEGKILMNWKFQDYPVHIRGPAWYFISGFIVILFVAYSFFTQNFLFGLIIILFVLLFYIVNNNIKTIEINIFEDGLSIGNKMYYYHDIEKFWIIYYPPTVKSLYIQSKGFFSPPTIVSLEDKNPLDVRNILSQYIPEDLDQEHEPPLDTLTRFLKL